MAAGDSLRAYGRHAVERGGPAAAAAMATEAERAMKAKLSERSHPPRTPTPSPPGSAPAIITGTLRRSVTGTPPRQTGTYRWETTAGPTVVYSRIQELGGRTGRNHATYLPPRPYVSPAMRELRASGRLSKVATDAFARAAGA